MPRLDGPFVLARMYLLAKELTRFEPLEIYAAKVLIASSVGSHRPAWDPWISFSNLAFSVYGGAHARPIDVQESSFAGHLDLHSWRV